MDKGADTGRDREGCEGRDNHLEEDWVEIWGILLAPPVGESSCSSICRKVRNTVSRTHLHSTRSIGMDRGCWGHTAHRGRVGRCHWDVDTQDFLSSVPSVWDLQQCHVALCV